MRNTILVLSVGLVSMACSACAQDPCVDNTCQFGPAEVPQQPLATQTIWRDFYGESTDPPPIRWVIQGDCEVAGKSGIADAAGRCMAGDYVNGPGVAAHIYAMVYPSDPKYQWTTFTHELLHAHLDRAFGDSDPTHLRPEWKPQDQWAGLDYVGEGLVLLQQASVY